MFSLRALGCDPGTGQPFPASAPPIDPHRRVIRRRRRAPLRYSWAGVWYGNCIRTPRRHRGYVAVDAPLDIVQRAPPMTTRKATPPDPGHQAHARGQVLQCILNHARRDERVLAVLDYGSTSEGRGDAWSDIDLALSIRSDAWNDFIASWKTGLAECGTVLLGFISFAGHPWAVLATEVAPVRVDLHLYGGPPDTDLRSALATWPNAPSSVENMLLFDREGTLTTEVEHMIGRSLAPDDIASTFSSVAANFWYYVHRTWAKLQRGTSWDVRWSITTTLTGNLCALLRLESGATDRWLAADAASGIEHVIDDDRRRQLNRCIPGQDATSQIAAFREIVELGMDLCAALAARHGVSWPEELGRTMQGYARASGRPQES